LRLQGQGIARRGRIGPTMAEHEANPATTRTVALTREESEVDFARVVAFSDGVFAIAITLLVLALEIPENASDVGDKLLSQDDDFWAYLLSFAVLGSLWLSHHRFFQSVAAFDGTLMILNLVYLCGIALVPFSSEVFGDFSGEADAVVLYAGNMAFVSAAFFGQVNYAYRKRLMKPKWQPYQQRFAGPWNLIFTGMFLVSIPVALVEPTVAPAFWVATFFFGRRVMDRLSGIKAP
jgi:uncharacterized membrane protein